MTRQELVNFRVTVFEEYTKRVKLGEFDANSSAIELCLSSILQLIDHTLAEMKKNVHKKA